MAHAEKPRRWYHGVVRLLLAALFLAAGARAQGPGAADLDRAQLLRMKPLIEDAFNRGRWEQLAPFVAEDFDGTMLLKKVRSRAEFEQLWRQIEQDFGKKRRFSMRDVKINPEKLEIEGGRALASGTADVTVDTPFGPVSYQSSWKSRLVKAGGQWRLAKMDSEFNPLQKMSQTFTTIVGDVWNALQVPDRIKAAEPDFDRGGAMFQFKGD